MGAQATRTIDEVTERLIDYRGKTPPKMETGIKLITAKVIKDGRILDGPHEYIAEESYDAWMRRGLPRQWDVLITTEAPLGEVAMLRTAEKVALAQRVVLLRGNPTIIDQRYYYQALKSPFVQGQLAARSSGTTVLGIKQSELREVKIPCYPLHMQKKIAGILSAYDDLIENNTRRIRILEEMAQAIYREWFVHFRFPGHKKGELVPSPLGPIPEGWSFRKLGEVVELAYGKALKAESRRKGNVPVYGSSGIVGFHDESLVSGPGIIVGRKGNVGTVHWCDGDFFPIDTVFYVLTNIPLRYTYYNLQTQNFISGDAAVPGLSRTQAYALPILVPAENVLTKFDGLIEGFFAAKRNIQERNKKLRETRDLLLPKLISGEMDVSDLDIMVGDEAA